VPGEPKPPVLDLDGDLALAPKASEGRSDYMSMGAFMGLATAKQAVFTPDTWRPLVLAGAALSLTGYVGARVM
jgi:hypothetical protein